MPQTKMNQLPRCTSPHYCIVPDTGNTIETQLQNCYFQLDEILRKTKTDKEKVIKQTIFVRAYDSYAFDSIKELCMNIVQSQFEIIPPLSIVAQSPADSRLVILEVMLFRSDDENYHVTPKVIDGINYVVIETSEFTQLICAGLAHNVFPCNIETSSTYTFDLMERILQHENMNFSDVVRQWNYIEGITVNDSNQEGKNQHYQIFNNIRSYYYKKSGFTHGYPSATGIGMHTGGVCIDFIAMQVREAAQIIPINNPVQINAHEYTCEMLGDSIAKGIAQKTSPKFERAKAIRTKTYTTIYISGTAAIRGQYSLHQSNITCQTQTTLENISVLISADNLQLHHLKVDFLHCCNAYFRVYVKYETDIPLVYNICRQKFPNVPILYVVAGICREELLVEIEGVIEYCN